MKPVKKKKKLKEKKRGGWEGKIFLLFCCGLIYCQIKARYHKLVKEEDS